MSLLKLYINCLNEKRLVTVEGLTPETTVNELKGRAAVEAKLEPKNFDLVYCGKVLEDHGSLATMALKNGAMLHVWKHPVKEVHEIEPPTDGAIQELVLAFRTAMMNPAFKTTILMQHLIQSDFINNMKAASPGLAEDPIALALLYDWELLLYFADPTTARKLIREHPCLLDVASAIAAAVHQVPAKGAAAARPWLGDEDEEMEEDDEEDEAAGEGGSRATGTANGGVAPAITRSQLSAALAAFTRNPRTSASAAVPATDSRPAQRTSTPNPSSQSRTFISSEMFNAALTQAMANMPSNNNVVPSSNPRPTSSRVANEEADLRQRYGNRLTQMRELGISDDSLSLRALQATNGDVQAAVNLIFAGLMGDE